MRFSPSLLFAALAAVASPLAAGSNWPQFRGPDATGVAEASNLPDTWSAGENVVWKTPMPGRGWSSPIVWGKKVFLTSVINEGEDAEPKKGLYFGGNRLEPLPYKHRWMVYCLDLESGKILWEREAHAGLPDSSTHIKNTLASETPVTDGERLYAYFGNTGLFVYDLDGEFQWKKRWKSYKTRYGWGSAASPVLHADRVYILNDNEEESFLVALDKKSGEQAWRVDRDEKSNWATPFVWKNDKRTEIVTAGTGKVRSYGLDGKLLWELEGMSKIAIPTPFASHGLLYVSSGYVMDNLKPAYAIRAGASGDISLGEKETQNDHIVWSNRKAGPYNPTPIVYGDYYYTLLDRGFFVCHEAKTGALVYGKQRISNEANAFTASPWAYDGKIFCLSEDGDTFVIEAGREFKVLGKNSLDEMCMASPAIVDGGLLIRGLEHLYRIGAAKGGS